MQMTLSELVLLYSLYAWMHSWSCPQVLCLQLSPSNSCNWSAGTSTNMCDALLSLLPAKLYDSMQAALLRVEEASEIRDQPVLCKGCKLRYISILLEAAAQVK